MQWYKATLKWRKTKWIQNGQREHSERADKVWICLFIQGVLTQRRRKWVLPVCDPRISQLWLSVAHAKISLCPKMIAHLHYMLSSHWTLAFNPFRMCDVQWDCLLLGIISTCFRFSTADYLIIYLFIYVCLLLLLLEIVVNQWTRKTL